MFSKLEKRKIMYKMKAMGKSIIIAFFLSAFTVFLICLTFGSKIEDGLSMLNTISLNLNYGDNDNVSFDNVKKRLVTQPSWGTKFGRLIIPSISVDIPIYHGDDKEQLVDGAGHFAGSYFPGEGGSIIFAAHNSHGLFYTLPEIKIGDRVTVETIYGKFEYEVYKTDIVDYRDNDAFPIQHDEEILMMYTCYPVDNVWYVDDRFLVSAKLVGESQ